MRDQKLAYVLTVVLASLVFGLFMGYRMGQEMEAQTHKVYIDQVVNRK